MDETRPQTLNRTDVWLIAVLALITLGLRTFQLATTEVTARDSISYIHIAWQLEHGDWLQVVPAIPQHPGYPVAILAASVATRRFFPNDLPFAMQLAAQLASAAASVLLVAPLYWLGRELFSRRVAFGAVLIFQCLPCSGRIMADGLSEGVFLLFAVTGLAAAMVALRSRSVAAFAVCGAAGGLAYLTRPEGLLIPAVAGLVLLGMQLFARWRQPWGAVLARGAVLAVAVLVVGGPYMVLIRGLTVKNTGNHLMTEPTALAEPPADGPLFAVWWQGGGDASGRGLWGLQTLGEVLSKAFFFVLWVPALAGLIGFHRRFRELPGAWVPLIVCATLAFLLYRVAVRMGYLSDRHTILILACGVVWAAAALDAVGRWLASLAAQMRPAVSGTRWADGEAWAACLLIVVSAAPLARTLEPMHGDRVGFRDTGRWLAEHVGPDAKVFDPFGWSGYYAGRFFREDAPIYTDDAVFPDGLWDCVVVEEGSNAHSHLLMAAKAQELAHGPAARELYRSPAARAGAHAWIVVYSLK